MKKKIFSMFLVFVMMTSLFAACGEEDTSSGSDQSVSGDTKQPAASGSNDDTWAVYWYLCGSDLETNAAAATVDLMEMAEVQLPENVNVVIQTGGAAEWQNELMDASKTQRWLYNSEGLTLIEEADACNMGDE